MRLWEAQGRRVLLASPTARSAKRLEEVVTGVGDGARGGGVIEASTVHRLLQYNPHRGSFTRNARCELHGPCVLLPLSVTNSVAHSDD